MGTKNIDLNLATTNIIDNLPGLIWIKDCNLDYIACNERVTSFIGFKNKKNIIGHNDYDLPWEKYAESYREGDKAILNGKTLSFVHPIQLCSGKECLILSKKSPILNTANKIIGILGFVSIFSTSQAVQAIQHLHHFDSTHFKNSEGDVFQYVLSDNFDDFGITKREAICLFHLLRGKTAKEFSVALGISKRTAEKHLESIRLKFNCHTRSEVISKAIELGFVDLLPSDYFIDKMNK